MHTFKKSEKKTGCYAVGRMQEIACNNGSEFVPMFDQLSFDSAIRLVNHLNGGDGDFTPASLKILEMCQS